MSDPFMGATPSFVQNSNGAQTGNTSDFHAPAIIGRRFNNVRIGQRADGYLNATAMCKANGKQWGHYWATDMAQQFAAELSRSIGIPIDHLVVSITTGPNGDRGTWVHPRIGYHLALWCSAKFAVKVTEWIEEIDTKGFVAAPGVTIQPPAAAPRLRSQSPDVMFRGLQRVYQNAGLPLIDAANAANRAVLALTGLDILAVGGVVLSGAPPVPPGDVPALTAPDHPNHLTVTDIGIEIGVRTGSTMPARSVNQALVKHGFQVKGATTTTPWLPTERGKPFAKFDDVPTKGESGRTVNSLKWKWEVISELLAAMSAS